MSARIRTGAVVSAAVMLLTALTSSAPAADITVSLKANVASPGSDETVSFGLPLPPDHLTDPAQVAVFDNGTEIPAYVETLVPWRWENTGGIRSVLIQFQMDLSGITEKEVAVRTGVARTQSISAKTPIENTLVDTEGEQGPRILALLPAQWMCDSWIAGPQIPASANTGAYSGYENWIQDNFPGTMDYDYALAEPWLYDRPTTLYKIYIRYGAGAFGEDVFKAAYGSLNTYRQLIYDSTDCSAPYYCPGSFSLKNPNAGDSWHDQKYSYTECFALHYMLTGDDRCLGKIRDIANFWRRAYGDVYQTYTPGRGGWTERHYSYNVMSFIHAYEILGDALDSSDVIEWVNSLFDHQDAPQDGFAPDGSWRHYSTDHGEGGYTLGSSVWMSSIMFDVIFKYYLMTGDDKALASLNTYADWVDSCGMTKQPWGDSLDMMWYYAGCSGLAGQTADYNGTTVTLDGPWADGYETAHSMELTYVYAAGYWAGGKVDQQFMDWIDIVFPVALNSSHLLYFLGDANPVAMHAVARRSRSGISIAAWQDPYNSQTEIRFTVLPLSGTNRVNVRLRVFSPDGRRVADLCNRTLPAGAYGLVWNTGAVPPGIYLLRLTADERVCAKQMVLMK
jgi:hypothetical protein